ncbi:JNK-interacting protein 1-like isoform X2 [Tigriopus californicus]|uniref:JNK-interacting protein 1-like isoform X2 n=1 Tax=Tigriopus californicus TaxID=6832 RepID=UPI0027DA9529|nr:JNK-interacting protein 1-like isoform X2 [Tigriopus californicus]
MGDREFEELLVNSAHRQYEPRIIPSHLNTSPRNYQLVHAITPLEENKSFLEKVQLGEVLCGIPEEDRLYPSFTNHNPPPASTYSQLQHSIETRFQNLPPRHIWSSSEDEEDEDEDELEECVLEACRKPTIRWSDRCSTQELKTTKIGGSHSETQSKNALVKTTPLWSNNVNNNNTNSRNDDNNHSHNNVKIASGNTTNTNASSSKKPVSNSIRPQGQQSSSCNNETFQRSRRRRQLPEVPKDKKPLEQVNGVSLLEEIREASCSTKSNSQQLQHHIQQQQRQHQQQTDPQPNFNKQTSRSTPNLDAPSLPPRRHCSSPNSFAYQKVITPGDDELGMLDSGEDGPAYDSGNSTSHSPDEHQLMQRSLLLNNSFTTTLEDTDYDPASLTSPQCDGFEMGGRQLPRVPIQYPPTRRVTPLFILPKKLELLDPTHRGLHRFIPRHYDEVEIDIGDPVYVQKEAEDLWCEGANLRSGKIGIFPLAHVVDVEYNDFDPNGVNSERKERYLLEYIGSVESHLYKGNAVLCQAVKKIVGAKVAPKKHACVIEISDKGIKMIDKSRLNLSRHPNQDYFYSLKNVTFCGFHPSNSQYLGFVTKHPKLPKYACHVFVGEGSTQHVAEACGRAFNRFYQKFIETAYPVEDIYLE